MIHRYYYEISVTPQKLSDNRHREQAAHQKLRHRVGGVARLAARAAFQLGRHAREVPGQFAGGAAAAVAVVEVSKMAFSIARVPSSASFARPQRRVQGLREVKVLPGRRHRLRHALVRRGDLRSVQDKANGQHHCR